MELYHIPTLQYFNTHIWQQSRQQLTTERLQRFHLLNGDVFYSIRTWPTHIQELFWKKPTGDNDSFQLMLFFTGNGCPPDLIAKWILTSQHWASHSKGEKRARQVDFIYQNLASKAHIWFYFDIYHGQWLYLNGDHRDSCFQ